MTDTELWHLLIHTPGPLADPAVPFEQASWYPLHRKLHIRLAEAGYLIASGPLPGRPGAVQTLVRGADTEELSWVATELDRAVVDGFLEVEIVPWAIADSMFDFDDEDDDEDVQPGGGQ
ncbi:hypothetical protein [Protaetiibacter larvae]|uniref:YCII-related domain-containing protein n=1 Tax=Protaetiibacter larvae TaxID=2592654 RepID=A0A5C1Y878_9MICO|nr:hypothetical protein [Protaetiibacter larvae]QEO09147.1 hypothetical protein FLP23_03415 [Protaetiibacter larvae]